MLRNGYNLTIFSLVALNLFFLYLNFGNAASSPALYFLDVGQGESELLDNGGMKVLIDAGQTNQIISSLGKIMSSPRYIDLGIISEPQANYFNGYNFLLNNYSFGAILWNGRLDQVVPEWQALLAKIKEQKIPMIQLAAGDIIREGDVEIKILSPSPEFQLSGETADTSLVEHIDSPTMKAIFTGGIGANVETFLIKNGLQKADVLKVAAHGSKNSSSAEFLNALKPKISVIGTGAKTPPAAAALDRLNKSGSLIFETSKSGTVKVTSNGAKLQVFTEK